MSLSDLASLGNLVSGVAVVITLVFLLLQMRQSDKNQRASIRMGRTTRANGLSAMQVIPEVTRAMAKAEGRGEDLSEVEARTYLYYCFSVLINWEDTYYQHRAGLLEDAIMETEEGTIRTVTSGAPFRAVWQIVRTIFSQDFRRYIDTFMEQVPLLQPAGIALAYNAALREQLAKAQPRPGMGGQ